MGIWIPFVIMIKLSTKIVIFFFFSIFFEKNVFYSQYLNENRLLLVIFYGCAKIMPSSFLVCGKVVGSDVFTPKKIIIFV